MALENFTTYTETDPNARIAVTASRITSTLLTRDEDAYVYADKGVNYFAGNFTHELTVRVTGGAVSGTMGMVAWAITNDIDDYQGLGTLSKSGLFVLLGRNFDATPYFQATERDSGTEYSSATPYTGVINTDYYLKIVRDETVGTYGTFYCYIYSDVGRTTLVATLSVTLHTSKKDFRYIFGALSSDTNEPATTISAYSEALEIVSNISSPVVTTEPCTSISTTTATGNGTITDLGSSSVTEHGHCWSTSVNPTTADSKTTKGAGSLGSFTSSITGLTAGLLYYVRAYATNSAGTSYGGNVSFRAGLPGTQMKAGNIAIKGTTQRYVGDDGIEYYLQGTAV